METETVKKQSKTWKVLAIIFITLFVLETMLIVYTYNIGSDVIEGENVCIINVCSEYEAYYYDIYTNICSCYIDGEIVHEEYLT